MSKKESEENNGSSALQNGNRRQPAYTPSQKAVAEVWSQVLQRPDIALTDNFFDLGGDSLKAMEVIARIHASLAVEIPLLAFFEDPTVQHAAEVVDSLDPEPKSAGMTATQAAIAQIWGEVLAVPVHAADQSFFDMGGDSLKAMEVIARIHAALDVELPLIAFFEDPTVAHAAEVVDSLRQGETALPAQGNSEGPLALSFPQLTFWLLQQSDPLGYLYNEPRVLRIRGKFRADILQQALDTMCRRHDSMRTRFVLGEGEPSQVVAGEAHLDLPVLDLSSAPLADAERAAMAVARTISQQPFDLSLEAPIRARLLQLAPDDHMLVVVIHHVLSDGHTCAIFFEELGQIYLGLLRGVPPALAEPRQYREYAQWERGHMQGTRLEQEIAYWSGKLEGAPSKLDLPTDSRYPAKAGNQGESRSVVLPAEQLQQLKSLALAHGTTLFTVLLAGLRILLHRWTGQQDIVIGTVVSNRSRAETERMLGCFLNFLPLRGSASPQDRASEVLIRERGIVMDAFTHQAPFLKIAAAASGRDAYSPVYNVALLLQNFPEMKFAGDDFSAQFLEQEVETALLDLRLIAQEIPGGLRIDCDFRVELFSGLTIQELLAGYLTTLTLLSQDPSRQVTKFEIPAKLAEQAEAARRREKKFPVVVASTFTAEPIERGLAFWMKELGLPGEFHFAPYNQVFQQLLDRGSSLGQNRDGFNILLVRPTDWQRFESNADDLSKRKRIEESLNSLVETLKSRAWPAPVLLCFCPGEKRYTENPTWREFLERAELQAASELSSLPGVHVLSSRDLLTRYPVEHYEDEYADRIGHIPFTQEFFNVVATMLARRIHGLRSAPKKVIVLDCDNTLWKGICGEEGPGVSVDHPHRALQEFMLDQQKAGMLLCLCSKNVEEDVDAVFAENPGMVLRPEHIAARRVNWKGKAQNLRELAADLQLGLDSFIFVDDNPLECAEVELNCPEVLTLQLPQEAERFPQFLKQVWAFDHWKVTEEDSQRTAMYRQNAEREQLRQRSSSLDAFLAGLELNVDIRPMEAADLQRVSQLTERTNQFNFTTIRRDETSVQKFIEAGGECLVVNLADRFGDYGLVGVLFYKTSGNALEADTLLLSCRALGRKVEHNMLARLGAIAKERHLTRVVVPFVASKKNQPAADFLNRVGARFKRSPDNQDARSVFEFPAEYAAEIPRAEVANPAGESIQDSSKPAAFSATSQTADQNLLIAKIAHQLGQASTITRAVDADRAHRSAQGAFLAPRTPTEEILAGIWAQVLKIHRISVNDNFFTLGGQSLLATQVIARIRSALGIELPLGTAFEASTIAELATRVEAAQRTGSGLEIPPIARQAKAVDVPLSFAQQRLWFLDQLEPGTPLYNISQMLRMRGRLDLTALHRSLNRVVERHESLRTTFGLQDGEPIQVIAPRLELPLPLIDVSDSADPENQLQVRATQEAHKPFDLARGPLLRTEVLRLGPDDHALLLTMHHVISDRWSMGVMAAELASHYEGFLTSKPAAVPELGVQYSDYALWQRSWLQGPALLKQADYWRQQLAGSPAVLELPTDRPRPAVRTNRGATVSITLPPELLSKLVALSQAEGATLFMALMAGFQSLLARYSGQEDIVVGSPIANRQHAEVEPLIGFFVNTLAIRGDLSGDPSFRQVIARCKKACLEAYAHQDIPFEKLVEELNPERSLSFSPIFQVMFALQNAPVEAPRLTGLDVERSMVYPHTSMFDMSWFAIEVPEGLMVRTEYSTDLFNEETVTRALDHFQRVLERAVANPEARISQLSLLGETERAKVLVEFNSSEAAFPPGLCLDDLVEQTTARVPDRDAVVCGTQRLSYRELNERANQIADYLIQKGAGRDVLVGVFLERTPDLLPAILGVLKSGSAYVPLDPRYPRERLAAILEDAKAPLVVTQSSLVDQVKTSGTLCVCVDSDREEIERGCKQNPNLPIDPHQLAYVLFTSGSTGRPKGVALEHQSAVSFVQWAQTVFTPGELAGVLFATSVCFDLSIFEIFAPLSVGGKAILVENALYLPSQEARGEVTLINTVPSAMAELVQMAAVPSSVKTINLAGEALQESLVNAIYRGTSVEKLYNLYGPTEDTTYSTYTLTHAQERVTIGRPLPNTQAYVLDGHQNPQPIGVPGELYLAGAGLARGYYGRPDLTAERFVSDPFSAKKTARMYRTGDLCRWLPDGNLEYLGRLDHQVKLRGFRIELGEIEAVLAAHASVRQCLVMPREDEPGLKRLVAYVVLPSGGAPREEEWRDHLKRSLPEFMIPSAFVVLAAFPLTPNGKIDRKALPVPEYAKQAAAYVAPRNFIETQIAGIWAQVLRIRQVGATDDFFALGGHSLLATQVVSRIRQSLHVEVPLRTVFEAPTVAQLAGRVEALGGKEAGFAPPIPRAGRGRNLPLSFAQQRLWFLNELEPDNPLYNIPIAVEMSGELNYEALDRSLNEIVRRHEVLRTSFRVENNQPVQVIAPELKLKVEVFDLTSVAPQEQQNKVKRMAIEGASAIFNLRTGPLFRAAVLRLSPRDHVLLLNMHHIASDGWSLWQFVKELAALYGAFVRSLPSPLEDLPIQYADYGLWQRQWMQGRVLEQHLDYWKKQLAGAPSVLELPADRIRPAVQTYRGATETALFPPHLLARLREISAAEGATLFMTLLAAYQTLIFRYTGQEDVVVGTPIANRTRAEIEELIGFFVNALVMRTDLSGDPSFRELIGRVRSVALEAYAHQDLPFEKLVEVLQPERDLTRTPLFQVWFALQNAPRTEFKLPGLDLRTMAVHNGTSKFDLGLFVVEKPEGLSCLVEYSTDLFDAATIRRFIGHFRTLLEGIAASPDSPISGLPWLTAAERHQIVDEWNDTRVEYSRHLCLHQLIEQQAQATPDAPALIFESTELTYRELNERANQLAHWLRRMRVGPDTLVGVCAERSVEMVVALLGTMKAGGAYVPLDPDYPQERLANVLEDAAPAAVLTQERMLEVLPKNSSPVLCLDRDWNRLADEPRTNPDCITNGKDQAYAIFTSGSTGKPKGVPNVHEGIVNRLLWMQHAYGLDATDRVMQKTPYSFDVSVWEFFWPLMTGACLVVAMPEGHKDPNYLIDLIERQQITTMHFVPSMLRMFLEADGVERCTSLRRVICSGEALPVDVQNRFFERLHAQLHNLYGPTEASVDVTYWECLPNDTRNTVPIGKPIWNTQIYILDKHLRPVPIGIPGELHIGGVGLARGYLNRPELTAEKFIGDLFQSEPGARLYKTGDLARFLPDGNVEYLGRMDYQVKIRGFRIELGEIESVLEQHAGVGQAVVMAREDQPGDKRLAAYIVADPEYRGQEQSGGDFLSAEQVAQWAMTFDEAYRQGGSAEDATFNIVGWNSSYTGKPIPSADMRVWVESTVKRILALQPRRVWEIGCGTGLLLFRVAPKCEAFRGTDVSQRALDFLQRQMERPDLKLPQVSLECRAAQDFEGLKDGEGFDTIVLNSVIQYFPDLDYLEKVLAGALRRVRPGGSIFIGDVRNFRLLETFHTSVEVFRQPESTPVAELKALISKGIRQEGELLVDPEFFSTLNRRFPEVTRVEMQLKRGHVQNELTRFRYDVVLHTGTGKPEQALDCHWIDWQRQSLSRDSLREALKNNSSPCLGISGVPNARLAGDIAALSGLTGGSFTGSLGSLRDLAAECLSQAVEPEEIWSLEAELPYTAEIRFSVAATDGKCDILFRKKGAPAGAVRFPGEGQTRRPGASHATNPVRTRALRNLAPDLRAWLGAKLPEFMVPSNFVLLETMPLSPNGKVDRKALPAPEQSSLEGRGTYVAPQRPEEELLASIWSDVLRIERVGIRDDFFDLGGHSLNATQVVSRVREAFKVEMPLRTLFESPTIESLARAITTMTRSQAGQQIPPIVPVPRDQPVPLSFAQQRLWFLDQMDPGNHLYNIPRAFRLAGTLDIAALGQALNELIARHEILRTNYRLGEADQPVQMIAAQLTIEVPVTDLSPMDSLQREEVAQRIVQQEAERGFDLARDPILRAAVLKLADADHVLFINTHHIASDGWSSGVMLNDLCSFYEAAVEKRPAPLPELPIQYADYSFWQRNWLQGTVLEQQLAYWKKQLAGAPPVLALPTDQARPPVQTYRGAMLETALPKAVTDGLSALGRQQGATMFMTLLAGFECLMHYCSGQNDIVLGTDLANRASVETEALIGFFVNLLPLRVDLSGDPTFLELIHKVREVSLNAYAYQDVPFDKLVEELNPERNLSYSPLVQVLFVQQNTPRSTATMPGIEMSRFRLEVESKFDMAVFMRETASEVAGWWQYNPDLFDETTMSRLAASYELILQAAISNPDARVSSLCELLAEADKTRRGSEQVRVQKAGLEKLKKIRRKAVADA